MRILFFLALAAAGCGGAEASRWRAAARVSVAVDGGQVLMDMRRAAASGAKVTEADLHPEYLMKDDQLLVWMTEDDVSPGSSYSPMSPRQALLRAGTTGGPGGVCVAEGDYCARTLSGADVVAIAAELEKDGKPDEGFKLIRKPG